MIRSAIGSKYVLCPSRCSLYLWPLFTVLAENLGDNSSITGVSCVQISLDFIKLHGRYGQKHAKNVKKMHLGSDTPRLLSQPPEDRFS